MPGSISDSYDGPADPCPKCRAGSRVVIDVSCHLCKGTTWLPDDSPTETEMDDRDNEDQEIIRDEYQEITSELRDLERDERLLEQRLSALQNECTHPRRGTGKDVDGFDVLVNECPDCGHCDPRA